MFDDTGENPFATHLGNQTLEADAGRPRLCGSASCRCLAVPSRTMPGLAEHIAGEKVRFWSVPPSFNICIVATES